MSINYKPSARRRQLALLASVAPFAIGIAGVNPAYAQTAPVAEEASDPEIIVTARNREEKLQDVPLAITSLSSETLENANVRNLRDVAYLTPGLSITSGGSEFGVNPVIRGQTNLNGGAGDPNVAVFIDGIYISNNTAINLGLMDIERIEVVKGPVSSLYGRNAFAGAINYVSKKPSLTEAHGKFTLFGGNDQQYSASGSVSYPLIPDVLAVKLAAGYEHFGGSYKDTVNGTRAGGFEKRDFQVSVLLEPSPDFRISAAYYYGKDTFGPAAIAYNINNCGTKTTPANGTDPGGSGYSTFCGHFDPDAHEVEVAPLPSFGQTRGNDRRVNLASINMTYDLGPVTLTSLTGYTKVTQQRFTDFIGRRAGIPFLVTPSNTYVNLLEMFGSNTNTEDFSEEIRLQTAANRPVRLQVGGFYFKGRTFSTTIIGVDGSRIPAGQTITGGFGQAIDYTTVNGQISQTRISQALSHDRQVSGFVGLDVDLASALTVSGEYRYTHQTKDQLIIRSTGCPSYLVANTASCTGPAPTPYLYPNGVTPVKGDFNFSNYRGTIKWKATPNVNFYASVANGNKAGGFNQRSVAAPDGSQPDLKFNPETNVTYELGMKASFFDNKVMLNLAAFHIDTKGIQISGPSSVPTNPGLVTKNFGSVHTDGFEAELAAKVAPGVKLSLGVGYADPRFGQDAYDFGAAGGCATLVTTVGPGGTTYSTAARGTDPEILKCAAKVILAPPGTPLNPVASPPNSANPKLVLPLNGLHVPRETNLQFTAGVDLDGAIGDSGWRWNGTMNVRYETKQYAFNNNISWYGPRTIVNLRAGVENETFSISAYVNNLTNDHTPEIVSVNARLSDFGGDLDGYLPIGRQFGVTLGAKF